MPAGATFVLRARATTAVALLATRKLVFVSFALPTTGATVSGGGVVGPPPPSPPSSCGTGAAVTATTRDVDALLPASSVAVIVTVAAPGSPNVCETTLPSAAEPSPKSQCSVVPLSVSAAAAAKPAGWPATAESGTSIAPKPGGVVSRSLTCTRALMVPVCSVAAQATIARPPGATAADVASLLESGTSCSPATCSGGPKSPPGMRSSA